MSAPEYFICLNCEAPVYIFEWDLANNTLKEILCNTCGADDVNEFLTQTEYDEQAGV